MVLKFLNDIHVYNILFNLFKVVSDEEKFIGSIDEGTSSTRFLVCIKVYTLWAMLSCP